MNIENLRKIFPQFKITDATDRTPEQLSRIQRISANIKDSFVFITRNKKNEKFFMHMERLDNEVFGSYGHISLTTSLISICISIGNSICFSNIYYYTFIFKSF